MTTTAELRATTEAWFVSRGIPHFIADYSARRDILTRALPVLSLVLLAEMVFVANESWSFAHKAGLGAAGIVVLVGGNAAANVVRHRPPLERPHSVGPIEIALFVLMPSLFRLVVRDDIATVALLAACNVALLAVLYVGASYAVIPMTRWAFGRLLVQVSPLANLVIRSLPQLILLVLFLFVNAEMWSVADNLHGPFFWITLSMFGVIGIGFVAMRIPKEVSELASFADWDEVAHLVEGTPLAGVVATRTGTPTETPLGRRQWGNVGLVVLFSQGVQVLSVAAMVGTFLAAFGVVALAPATITSWLGGAPHILAETHLWGRDVIVTEELLRVVAFLTSFSALYFTVVVLSDTAYREEFLNDVVGELRQSFAVRAVYHDLLAQQSGALEANVGARQAGLRRD